MEETYLLKHPGVKKKILAGGRGPLPCFSRGTKLVFHFQTLLDNFERTVIDDSRKNKHPTEIFVGKMFKMEVWEVLLTSMRLGEVAEFWCDATHTGLYPIVSKGMRLAAQGKDPLEGQKHTCGMGNVFTYHSTGFPELDKLMMEPQPLIFIMELISVGDPLSYVRESWLMEKDEKMQAVPSLHLQGNALVQQGRYADAAEMYREAVLLLRTVQSREMPGDEDYVNLSKLITPLVLNYCQCKLELEEYYEVIEHTSELIDKHKDCVKAYYKRAKAYAAVWSEREARRDFLKVADLDGTLARLVQKELQHLSERMKEKYWEEKERYWNMLKEKTTGKEEAKEEIEGPGEGQRGEEEEPKKNFQCPPAGAKGQNKGLQMPAVTEGKDRQQMLRLMMLLQDEGIFCIKEQHFSEATLKFKEALEYVDYLQSKEVDDTGEDWESLEKVRLPLALNLSQCRLELGQFHEVIELNNKILSVHKDNVKAMCQRARAHAALCDEEEARRDFSRAAHLNAALRPIVKQELRKLGEKIRAEHVRTKKNCWSSSQERQEQEAMMKTANRAAMERGVKSAAESQASGGGGEVVVVAQAEEEGAGTGEERSLRLPGHRQSQNSKESSLDEKWMSPLALKDKRAEMGHELVGREGDSARADVARDNPTGVGRGSKVKQVSHATAWEETRKNESATWDTGDSESQGGAL